MEFVKPTCRICDSAEEFQEIRAPFVFGGKEEHNFWECRKCTVVYLYPPTSEEEEAYFYRKEFEKFMDSRAGSERDWTNASKHVKTNQDQVVRRWKFLESSLFSGMDLLELGCSSGFMLDAFKKVGAKCVGVEPSGEFIEFIRGKGIDAYKDLAELKLKEPKRKYDLITHFFLFEHIRNPVDFLLETYELLKPGGKMIMEVPCVHDPLTSLYDIPAFEKFYWSIAHHYYYSKKSIEYLMNKMDFNYILEPEQRYDLSNHMTWATDGKPGGQGRFNHVFSKETIESYKKDLVDSWVCDTFFLTIVKD